MVTCPAEGELLAEIAAGMLAAVPLMNARIAMPVAMGVANEDPSEIAEMKGT